MSRKKYICERCRKMIEAPEDQVIWCLDCNASNGKGHPAMQELK